MEELKGNQSNRLGKLFPDYTWNYIADSILEGSMGTVLVNDKENTQVASLSLPEHKIHIMGGDAQHPAASEYLAELPGFSLLIFGAPGWPDLLNEVQIGKVITLKRYAFSSAGLDLNHLNALKSQLPKKFKIERIDLQCARQIVEKKNHLTEDHLFGFASAEDFIESGIGQYREGQYESAIKEIERGVGLLEAAPVTMVRNQQRQAE